MRRYCSYKIQLFIHKYLKTISTATITRRRLYLLFLQIHIILVTNNPLYFCSHMFFLSYRSSSSISVFVLYWSIPRSVFCRLLTKSRKSIIIISSFMHYSLLLHAKCSQVVFVVVVISSCTLSVVMHPWLLLLFLKYF